MLVEEVHTGRVLAMQGGFDVLGSSYNRAVQALRQPGSAFKPIVYVTALENGFTPATIEEDAPFCVYQGAGLGNKCFVNFDRRSAGPHTMRWGVEQSRNLMTVRAASTVGMPKITDTARKLGVGDYGNYLSFALGAGDTTVPAADQRLCDPCQSGPIREAHNDRFRPRSYRQGHLPNRQPLRRDGQLQRPRLGRQSHAAASQPHSAIARSDGGIPDGPHHGRRDPAGTATVLRDLNRPLFGKTGTTNGPTNVWFVGGTPDIVAGVYLGYDQPKPLGGWAQGGRISAPIWKEWALTALKDEPKVPFVAPSGIRWVRIDRASGKAVYGVFPTDNDPKAGVIWEAFQPQTEPRRSYTAGRS